MRRRLALGAAMLAIVLGGVATDLAAQTETGRISGTVRDPQGAAVPGVTVTLKSTTTDAQRTTVTDSSGNYVLANILPGSLQISFQIDGFKTVATKTQVAVGEAAAVNAALEVGGISEVVSVTAAVERINTRNSELATRVTQTQLRELPTITRDPYDLAALAGTASDQDPSEQGAGISLNGLRGGVHECAAGRRRQQRRVRRRGRPAGAARRGSGIQRHHQQLLRAIRLRHRRHRQRAGEIRHEPAARLGLRILPQREAGHEHVRQQGARDREEPVQSQPGTADLHRRADQA